MKRADVAVEEDEAAALANDAICGHARPPRAPRAVVPAALRCIDLTAQSTAIALAEGGRGCGSRPRTGSRTGHRRRMRMHPDAIAVRLAAADGISGASSVVAARVWRGRGAGHDLLVHEEALRVPEQGGGLTLATAPGTAMLAS